MFIEDPVNYLYFSSKKHLLTLPSQVTLHQCVVSNTVSSQRSLAGVLNSLKTVIYQLRNSLIPTMRTKQ